MRGCLELRELTFTMLKLLVALVVKRLSSGLKVQVLL